jgi:hypothetical protein
MTLLYTDDQGNRYRAVGRCPYSELVPGTPFALPEDPGRRAYVRGAGRPQRKDKSFEGRLLAAFHHKTVIVLEKINLRPFEGD